MREILIDDVDCVLSILSGDGHFECAVLSLPLKLVLLLPTYYY